MDDGAYSAVQIIIETVRRRLAGQGDIAAELLKQLKEPKHSSEYRLKITVNILQRHVRVALSGILLLTALVQCRKTKVAQAALPITSQCS